MKSFFTLLILSTALSAAQDVSIEEVRKSPVEAKFVSGGTLRMDLCSGGIELVGTDDNRLRVTYPVERGDVKVRIRTSGDRASLAISGCPNNNFRLTIEVPKKSGLYVRMMAGQLDVREITGDKDIVLHFGQLTLDVGNAEDYARAEASVNSGQIDAPPFGVSKGGLFRSFDRKGPGRYRVYAHVGAGQLALR